MKSKIRMEQDKFDAREDRVVSEKDKFTEKIKQQVEGGAQQTLK